MRKFSNTLIAVLGLCATMSPLQSHAENALNATLGTTGAGLEWITPFSDHLRGRVLVQYGALEVDIDEEDIDYKAEWDSTNFGALLDWHPLGGTFRFSLGLVRTSFGFDLTAESNQAEYDIGDSTYTGDLRLKGDMDFSDIAPYLALGWSSRLNESGIFFGGEVGVMYLGKPNLSYLASGTASSADVNGGKPFDVSNNPEFQSDLEQERQDLEDDLEDYSLWPVVNLSIGYRF